MRFILLATQINEDGKVHTCAHREYSVKCIHERHSGTFAMVGSGSTTNVSKKLCLAINSSTETENSASREILPKCS